MNRRLAGTLAGIAIGVAGVLLLWLEVRDLPARPSMRGMPSGPVMTAWILAGIAAIVAVGALLQPYRHRGAMVRPSGVDPWDLPFLPIGVATVGLLGAITPYLGGLALAAFAVDVNLRQRARVLDEGELRKVRLTAGAHLLLIGLGYLWVHRELADRGIDSGLGGLGAAMALLAPGLRLIAGSFVGEGRPAE